ncbi:MAG: SH3 domain-containing protein [Microcystaceae cyanobacterium]
MSYFIFPFRTRPSISYKNGGRNFGAGRSGGRKHAGCDLIAAKGTEILAMADGKVITGPYYFYSGTYALEIKHDNGIVIRYGEIGQSLPTGIRVGARVSKGQVIAYVGRLNSGSSMLHLEMYKGTQTGALTQTGNRTYHYVPSHQYQRRSDLLDPTSYLDNANGTTTPPVDGQLGTVNAQVTTGLNVRNDAKLSAPIQFTLNFGETCIVTDKLTGETYAPNQNLWYKIYKDGNTGFAAATFIDVEQTDEPDDQLAKGRVNNNVHTVLNVRSQASANSDIVVELSPNATCYLLEKVIGDPYPPNNQTEWYKVKVSGQIGFAAAYYIDEIDNSSEPSQPSQQEMAEGRVNYRVSSSLNARSKPSTDADVVFSLTTGISFKVLEEVSGGEYDFGRTDWLKIDYEGKQGYVAAYYVDINLDPQPASRWDQALMLAPTTGASTATASQDGLPAGVSSSHKMAQTDLQRVKVSADHFCTAAAKFGVPAAILAAIASRESRCGNILSNGWGDGGNAFGIMQVDKRYHSIEGTPDPKSLEHIEQATGIFVNNLQQVQQKHPDWDDRYVIKGAAVAYNAGLNTVQTITGMDRGTTGDDYGSDVIARAQYYANHAELSVFRINM